MAGRAAATSGADRPAAASQIPVSKPPLAKSFARNSGGPAPQIAADTVSSASQMRRNARPRRWSGPAGSALTRASSSKRDSARTT